MYGAWSDFHQNIVKNQHGGSAADRVALLPRAQQRDAGVQPEPEDPARALPVRLRAGTPRATNRGREFVNQNS